MTNDLIGKMGAPIKKRHDRINTVKTVNTKNDVRQLRQLGFP